LSRAIVLLQRYVRDKTLCTVDITLATSGGFTGWNGGPGFNFGSVAGYIYKRGIQLLFIKPDNAGNLTLALGAQSALPTPLNTLGIGFFTSLTYDNAAGSPVTVLTSAAVYSQNFSSPYFYSLWRWGDGLSPVWSGADAGEVKRIVLA
jgi:hypothetical protein